MESYTKMNTQIKYWDLPLEDIAGGCGGVNICSKITLSDGTKSCSK